MPFFGFKTVWNPAGLTGEYAVGATWSCGSVGSAQVMPPLHPAPQLTAGLRPLQTALAVVFALAALGTTLFTYGVPLLDPGSISADNLLAAAPGTALVAAVLAAHEGGHIWVRKHPSHSLAS